MKTAISIPDPVFRAADDLARRLRMSRSRLYAEAIRSYLKTHRFRGVKESLNAVYEREDSSLDPVLMRMQVRVLEKDDW